MATAPQQQPIFVDNIYNIQEPRFIGGPEFPTFKETAAQAWKQGDLLYLDANGTLAICTYTQGANTNLHSSKTASQAISAASGVTGQKVYSRTIRKGDIYEMNVYHATIGSAITAQTQLGTMWGLIRVGNKVMVAIGEVVGNATVAGERVKIIGFSGKDALGDTYGRVLVLFTETSTANDLNPQEFNLLQFA